MSARDTLQRFMFEHCDLRGEIVNLDASHRQVLDNNANLPDDVQRLLGEFNAAAVLLSSSLKFDGILTLQARGDGPVPLLMAECTHHSGLRAIARLHDDYETLRAGLGESPSLAELIGKGHLSITIEPDKGQRYQGIVPLDRPELSGCLEAYFAQSEQLPTRFWLHADAERAAGLMLQALPQQQASAEANAEHWQTAETLAATITADELLSLEPAEVLHRLFHELEVRVFDAKPVKFACTCSRERSAQTLSSLGEAEIHELLEEQDVISIHCHFCHQEYIFGSQNLDEIFPGEDKVVH